MSATTNASGPPDPAQVTVRAARLEDLPGLVDLLLSDRSRPGEPDLAPYAAAFARMTAASGQVVGLGELDGQVVGLLHLSLVPSFTDGGDLRAYVEGVHTLSSLRGRGIGEALFAWAIDTARARGARSVRCTSDASLANVHRYYEHLGFTADEVGFTMPLR